MAENFLQFSLDKAEDFVIGPEDVREKLLPKLRVLKPSQSMNNLGIIFNSELNFIPR